MTKFHILLFLSQLCKNLSPKSGAVQNISLIHGAKPSASCLCQRKCNTPDSFDFMSSINQLVSGHLFPIFLGNGALSEIQSSGKLSNHHDIEAIPNDFFLQRAGIPKLLIKLGRAKVTKKTKLLSKRKKARLRPLFHRQRIPGGNAYLSPNASHQHCLGSFAGL